MELDNITFQVDPTYKVNGLHDWVFKYGEDELFKLPGTFTEQQVRIALELFKAGYKVGFRTSIKLITNLSQNIQP
ncbi:hypothetical protein NIES23_64270 (plasmid) [Trichormus variabilis NIES-23]|uniref:Uncharacterized protein n=1 Tax=Trichormus variabilis NIES-23 TaxID=1973479 RepID=A0A1Z4KX80_ANAVA|nr:hypothetical protein NIES23_64270 [Trichormus variabilis NIES-23]